MDAVVQRLARDLLEKLNDPRHDTDRRYLVGLCGIPGSGKSILAQAVVHAVNALHHESSQQQQGPDIALVVGMDGWHLTRAQLEAMPDPKLARDRRGSEWTFDAKGFADFVEALHAPISAASTVGGDETGTLWAPSFSHSVKDPVERDIPVPPTTKLVLIEGLYANLDTGEWARASRTFHERWLIQTDRAIARQRLLVRHVQTGVAADEAEAGWRADHNDLPNGDYLLAHLQEPILRLDSVADEGWILTQQR
ncbi:hypothetical protein OC844_003031 [Tilletia horrida]|nr:hypothetical protein OC844_003031 [Tilletia horrida]